jgi:hypothetical protein
MELFPVQVTGRLDASGIWKRKQTGNCAAASTWLARRLTAQARNALSRHAGARVHDGKI